ncbi:hypothetical protein ACFYO7_21280 [Nocardia salmonicida]|uniref:hypothetical protein n=1 Tax=Nocardia salmonicida TaxID=53431 RepID=UPI0036AFF516
MSVKKVLPGAQESSQTILAKARAIKADLEDFKADFDGFFNTQSGDMKEAAAARQTKWTTLSNELTTIIDQAAQKAEECQNDFIAEDKKMAGWF